MVKKILVVDDDPSEAALVRRVLEPALGVLVDVVVDGAAFARRLVEADFGLVVIDLDLSWGDGLEALEAVKAVDPDLPVVLLTASAELEVLGGAVALGLSALVPKSTSGYAGLVRVVGDLLGSEVDREEQTGGVTDTLPVGMFVVSGDGQVEEASPGLARILGFESKRQIEGRPFAELLAEPGDRVRWQTQVTGRRATRDWEVLVAGGDGSPRWVRIVSNWSDHGRGAVCRGAVEDISDFKRVEESFSRQARALERSNEELREYARVVSHDLQEPLQLISRYATMLGELDEDDETERGRRYLEHVVASAERMQEMVDGILAYSRVEAETETEPKVPVALGEAVAEALENLAVVVEEAAAEVRVGELPTVQGHRGQLVRLFQNLLSNAAKFRGDEPARVEIDAREDGDQWEVTITDSGIGIEEKDRERIFAMGERLHPASRYPGSGLGLAICRRIVEHHGGTIWIGPGRGSGTTAHIRLPKSTERSLGLRRAAAGKETR